MKHFFNLLTLLCFALYAQAETAVYQEVNYTIDPDYLTAEVTLNPQVSGELYIPDEITVGQDTYRVTTIGEKAFKGCKNLTDIVLPPTIERIYRSAFDGTGIMLDKTKWTDGALYIDSCLIATDKTIKGKFIIPEGTRLIAAGAFQGNKTLTRMEFPASVKRIDHETFRDCKNLTRAIIPLTITEISVLRHVFQFNSITPHRLMKILCLVSCFCRIDNICFLFAGKKDSMNNNDKWGRMKECSFCDILFIRLTHPSQSP